MPKWQFTIYGSGDPAPISAKSVAFSAIQRLVDRGCQVDAAEFRVDDPPEGPQSIWENVPTVEEYLAAHSQRHSFTAQPTAAAAATSDGPRSHDAAPVTEA